LQKATGRMLSCSPPISMPRRPPRADRYLQGARPGWLTVQSGPENPPAIQHFICMGSGCGASTASWWTRTGGSAITASWMSNQRTPSLPTTSGSWPIFGCERNARRKQDQKWGIPSQSGIARCEAGPTPRESSVSTQNRPDFQTTLRPTVIIGSDRPSSVVPASASTLLTVPTLVSIIADMCRHSIKGCPRHG